MTTRALTDDRGVARVMGIPEGSTEADIEVLNPAASPAVGYLVGLYEPAPPPPPPIVQIPLSDLGVPGDGEADAGAALTAIRWADLPLGAIVWADRPTYHLATPAKIGGARELTLELGESLFFRRPEDDRDPAWMRLHRWDMFAFDAIANLTIQRGVVRGWQTGERPVYSLATEWTSAFYMRSGENIIFRNINAGGVGGDGIQINGRRTSPARSILIENPLVDFVGRQAITGTNCVGLLVEGGELSRAARSGFDFEPYDPRDFSNLVHVRKTKVRNLVNNIVSAGGAGQHNGLILEELDGLGGLGFLAAGGNYTDPDTGQTVFVPVTGLRVLRCRYTWDDPYLVQTRNLGCMRVRASDPVEIVGNVLMFKSEDFRVLAPGGVVRQNEMRGVSGPYTFNSGLGAQAWDHADNLFFNRRGVQVDGTFV